MTNVLRLFADEVGALPALAFSSLKLFYRRLADELASAVLSGNSVDPRHQILGEANKNRLGQRFSAERRATHGKAGLLSFAATGNRGLHRLYSLAGLRCEPLTRAVRIFQQPVRSSLYGGGNIPWKLRREKQLEAF